MWRNNKFINTNGMAKVFVYDEFNPQDTAMMQALYSRSPQSVTEHVEKVKQTGSGSFMEKFYVGYGHMSIADCGSTTLFIEGVSMLADKAIQDWQMYSGQETSTRYIDMSKQSIIDPVSTGQSKAILDRWMAFYISNQDIVAEHIKTKYPRKPEENESMYEKAVKARAFDSLRGFLPAGITTQLSWHTNLRQAWDKLSLLRHHPLKEVQEVAEQMLAKLQEKYAHSFSHPFEQYQEMYREYIGQRYTYFNPEKPSEFAMRTDIDAQQLAEYKDLIFWRPEKTSLPQFLAELGTVTFDFPLDFGSFRDIQRHRNGVCRMPLLTTHRGFHEWYLEQLPAQVRLDAEKLIVEQIEAIEALGTTAEIRQYYIAMGFLVDCRVTYGIPAAVYVTELRSGKPVHPTLRKVAHLMHRAFMEKFPFLRLRSDLELDDWDVRRGSQDITEK
jgi:thymidylate synthase ThyX